MNSNFSTPVLFSNPFVTLDGGDTGNGSDHIIEHIMPIDPNNPVWSASVLPDDAKVLVNTDGEISE